MKKFGTPTDGAPGSDSEYVGFVVFGTPCPLGGAWASWWGGVAGVVMCGWRRDSGGTAFVACPPREEPRSWRGAPGRTAVVGVVDELVDEVVEEVEVPVVVVVGVVRRVVVPRVVVEVEVVAGAVDVVVTVGTEEVGSVVVAGAVEVCPAVAVDDVLVTVAVVLVDVVDTHESLSVTSPGS